MKHVFAVCAYGESPYLEECIQSLAAQEKTSPVLLCTATPSERLAETAALHGLRCCVNPDPPDIAGDWNFALACCREEGADFATLCHQDDLYLPGYGAACRAACEADPELLIWFSDYGERRGGEDVTASRLLRIKRLLLWRLRVRAWQTSRWAKRRSLAWGDPICCPAVTFNLKKMPQPLFERGMTTNLDWSAWERLSALPGAFRYDPRVLMLHRIHPGSTTTKVLADHGRTAQDRAMFERFWPRPVAALLTRLYALSEKSNQV